MKQLEKQIERIVDLNLNSFNIDSQELRNVMVAQLVNQFRMHNYKNLQILLDFCKLVEKEEKGLLFIRNMIKNIIDE